MWKTTAKKLTNPKDIYKCEGCGKLVPMSSTRLNGCLRVCPTCDVELTNLFENIKVGNLITQEQVFNDLQ